MRPPTLPCSVIEDWIDRDHTHPFTRRKAYRSQLQPCPEMQALVLRVKELHNLTFVQA